MRQGKRRRKRKRGKESEKKKKKKEHLPFNWKGKSLCNGLGSENSKGNDPPGINSKEL